MYIVIIGEYVYEKGIKFYYSITFNNGIYG